MASLYERIGGEAAVAAAVDKFYGKIVMDPLLAPLFEQTNMDRLKAMQKSFLTMVFGGPNKYTGVSLKEAHRGRGISDQHFKAVAQHLSATLKELKVPTAEHDEVMAIAGSVKGDIVDSEVPVPPKKPRRCRPGVLIAMAALASAAAAGGWFLMRAGAPVGSRESELRIGRDDPLLDQSSANQRDLQEDQLLPGVVGAVRQAFVALVEKQCDIVFDEVDHNSDGKLSSAELHIAVLLAYGRLNQILGSMALKPPGTREVKALLAQSKDGQGQLTREEFKEVFVRKFMHQVAARAAARLLTHKVIVPAGGVLLNFLSNELHLGQRLEKKLAGHSGWTGPKGMVVRGARRTVTNKAIKRAAPALGPLINMNLAAALAQMTHLEDALEGALTRRNGKDD